MAVGPTPTRPGHGAPDHGDPVRPPHCNKGSVKFLARSNAFRGMSTETDTKFAPMTPAELAASLGVQLSQRGHPDLSVTPPTRFITLEEAKARGMSWYYTGEACRYGDQAARRTSNPGICSDCQRRAKGKDPVYPKSRAGSFYPEPRRKAADPSAPAVIAPAPPAPAEPTKREMEYLAALADCRDMDLASERTGFPRAQVEARASANETFRKPLSDLLDRLQIPRTVKATEPDAGQWTPAREAQLVNAFIDTGMLHTARENLGISASAFYAHLERSPTFSAAIEAARPRARETLRDRAIQAADRGQTNLLKMMEEDAPESVANMSVEQQYAEITRLLLRFQAQGLLPKDPTSFIYKKTGETIEAADLIPADELNNDLVSA
jgi:hypothetical protein